jgi:hypothetical protein
VTSKRTNLVYTSDIQWLGLRGGIWAAKVSGREAASMQLGFPRIGLSILACRYWPVDAAIQQVFDAGLAGAENLSARRCLDDFFVRPEFLYLAERRCESGLCFPCNSVKRQRFCGFQPASKGEPDELQQ